MTDETHHDPTKELAALQQALDALTPLDPDGRQRAVTWLAGALGVSSAPAEAPGGFGTPSGSGIPGIDAGPANLGTPRRFMAAKRPTTDVERVTCLAYYLTHARDTPHFKTKELTDLNTEAAGAKISNPSQATGNAKDRNGYLAEAGGGKRQITPLGEAVVIAMPDREAVARAIADGPNKARRKAKPKKKERAEGRLTV
jgi:hypothetical protein